MGSTSKSCFHYNTEIIFICSVYVCIDGAKAVTGKTADTLA